MIRVGIVENQELVRQGLRRILELDPELAVVGEARDGEEALKLVRESHPDVVLLDVRMPKLDGIGVLRTLGSNGQQFPPCLMLTTFDDPDALLAAVRAGAKGYLLKDVSFEQLTAAIRALAGGGTFIQPTVTEGLLRGLDGVRGSSAARADSDEPEDPLTGRELEVLRLMAGGYSNREIARALFVAERTVKNHVSSILAKLYVRDRTRAVLKALDKRLI